MQATDVLKKMRGNDSPQAPEKEEGMDSGEENQTPRLVKLSDDEQKAFANAKPGEDLACEVHGSLDGSGMFRVMTVSPLGGAASYGGADEQQMAGQVANKVMPGIQA